MPIMCGMGDGGQRAVPSAIHDIPHQPKCNTTERARALLAESAQGVNPLEGWTPEVPEGEILEPGTGRYLEMEALGEGEMGGA